MRLPFSNSDDGSDGDDDDDVLPGIHFDDNGYFGRRRRPIPRENRPKPAKPFRIMINHHHLGRSTGACSAATSVCMRRKIGCPHVAGPGDGPQPRVRILSLARRDHPHRETHRRLEVPGFLGTFRTRRRHVLRAGLAPPREALRVAPANCIRLPGVRRGRVERAGREPVIFPSRGFIEANT